MYTYGRGGVCLVVLLGAEVGLQDLHRAGVYGVVLVVL